ncbi:MAG: hypothetical protein AB8B51_10445 [Sedimentitalea sp.]
MDDIFIIALVAIVCGLALRTALRNRRDDSNAGDFDSGFERSANKRPSHWDDDGDSGD